LAYSLINTGRSTGTRENSSVTTSATTTFCKKLTLKDDTVGGHEREQHHFGKEVTDFVGNVSETVTEVVVQQRGKQDHADILEELPESRESIASVGSEQKLC